MQPWAWTDMEIAMREQRDEMVLLFTGLATTILSRKMVKMKLSQVLSFRKHK